MADQDARIRNLQGLLRWSASQETGEQVRPEEIDPEKRAYLEQLMSSMTSGAVDEMHRIFQLMQLDEATGDDATVAGVVQAKFAALEALQDLIEDIDVAGDFVKIGGVGVCYAALDHPYEPIRLMAITCLAAASQNHPVVQDHLFKTGALDKYGAIVSASESSPRLRERAVRGLSCLVRGDGVAHIVEAFVRSKGGAVLAGLLARPDLGDGAITKVSYLVASLAQDFPRFRNVVKPAGVLDALVGALAKTDDDAAWEQTLRALLNCSEGKPATTVHLQQGTDLLVRLTAREAVITARPADDRGALEEEIVYAATLRDLPADPPASTMEANNASGGAGSASGEGEGEGSSSRASVDTRVPLAIAAAPAASGAAAAAPAALPAAAAGAGPPGEFIPTHEWQAIEPGQMIPGGLETRMDMQSGVNWARMTPKA